MSIQMKNLTKSFGDKQVLKGFSLEVHEYTLQDQSGG